MTLIASFESDLTIFREKRGQFFDNFSKLSHKLISECCTQTLAGYYFLPEVDPKGKSGGFVVLLREVRHLPRRIAQGIADGLDKDAFGDVAGNEHADVLSFEAHDFAQPVGLLRSPEVEHLMQLFTNLFARIGVEDVDKSLISSLQKMHSIFS